MRWKICGVLALSLSLGLSACQALEAGLVREETWQRVVLEDGEEAAEETAGADESGEEAGRGSATPGGESAQPGGETAQSGDFYDRQLRPETREICRTYFKAGDYRRQMTIVPGGRQDRNRVTVNLYRQDGQGMGKNLEHQMDFWYEDGVSRYSTPVGGPDGVLDANSPSASVIFQEDGGVALYSAAMEEAEGVYYPEEDLLWAEAFERPLNRADTAGMSQGTLRLLRNQYYAVYGRKFDDPQLAEYFSGSRREFHLPLRPRGSGFQQRVWQALQQIPYGQTRSYSQIAEAIGAPKAARAVGLACNRNPLLILIPCHRVVGRDGRLVGYAGGLDRKERLLSLEARTLG